MSAPTAAPVATRPSAYYFAPDLRLIKLEDKLQTGGENGTVLKGHILADLVSAEVTMVNTGLATYTLTFNNTILTTAKDRERLPPTDLGLPVRVLHIEAVVEDDGRFRERVLAVARRLA